LFAVRNGELKVGKTFQEHAWDDYLSNHEDSERDAVAVMLAPASSGDIAKVYESFSEEIAALPLAERSAFDEFAEEQPRKKSLNQFIEQKRYEAALHVHSSSCVIDEPGFWREELRDSKAVKVFKHVVANYMSYRCASPARVMTFAGANSSALYKPRVAANKMDFFADVSICVRKAVKPSLYNAWDAFFVMSNGENVERIPKYAFFEMAELAGKQFLKSGLFPVAGYFRPVMVRKAP
jgi:hypothetical protein